MNLNLTGKRALVCGSTQGIGKAAAIELAALGAAVTLLARDEVKLKSVVTELSTIDGQAHDYIVADFNVPKDLGVKIEKYARKNEIVILINNTGGPPPGPALSANLNEFISAFASHLLCNQILVQALVPGMKSATYGRIVNVISTSVKMPIPGLGVSNTIRGAVASWSKTLSIELGPFGITVNNVLPGSTMTGRLRSIISEKSRSTGKSEDEITTDMIKEIPARRIADASEVAAAIAFLASPAAGYINGINIPVDGGRTGTL